MAIGGGTTFSGMTEGRFSKSEKRIASLLCTGSACFSYAIMIFYFIQNDLVHYKLLVCITVSTMLILSMFGFIFAWFRINFDALVSSACTVVLSVIPWIYFCLNKKNGMRWNLMFMQAGLISIMALMTLGANIWVYLGTRKTKKSK